MIIAEYFSICSHKHFLEKTMDLIVTYSKCDAELKVAIDQKKKTTQFMVSISLQYSLQSISSRYENQVDDSEFNFRRHVFAFNFAEIQLRKTVDPVCELHDVEEFQHEWHMQVRIIFPQRSNIQQ